MPAFLAEMDALTGARFLQSYVVAAPSTGHAEARASRVRVDDSTVLCPSTGHAEARAVGAGVGVVEMSVRAGARFSRPVGGGNFVFIFRSEGSAGDGFTAIPLVGRGLTPAIPRAGRGLAPGW